MSGNSQNNRKTTKRKKILERLKRPVRRVRDYFSQRYVWLSLTIGFLWMFSVPFIVTLFQEFLGDRTEQFAWIFQTVYFPFTLASYLLSDVVPLEIWIVIYGFAFFISMLFCFCISYIIHRVRSSAHEHYGVQIESE